VLFSAYNIIIITYISTGQNIVLQMYEKLKYDCQALAIRSRQTSNVKRKLFEYQDDFHTAGILINL
jgi:hypothetical protein